MFSAAVRALVVFLLLPVFVLPSGSTALLQDTLTETFTAEDGSYTLHYPAGWVYEVDPSGLMLANNPQSLAQGLALDGKPAPGMLIVTLLDDLEMMSNGLIQSGAGGDPLSIANQLIDAWAFSEADFVVSAPTVANVDGLEVARFSLSNPSLETEGLGIVSSLGADPVVFIAMGRLGELTGYEPTILSIVSSLEPGTLQPQLPPIVPDVPTQPLVYGQPVDGDIVNGVEQRWTFTGTEGEILLITVTSSAIDTLLDLLGPDGSLLATDDDSGGLLNPQIANLELAVTGEYTVVVRSYSNMGTGEYVLQVNADTLTEPGMIAYGDHVTADMHKGTGDRWYFVGFEGDFVTIAMTAGFDNYLELHDADNVTLITNDDGGGATNALISMYALPADGTYAIIARSYNMTTTGRYTLELTQSEPLPPTEVEPGVVIHTVLQNPLGDTWLFDGTQGQRVTVAMSGSFDTVLELYAPDESLVARNDDTDISFTSIIDEALLPQTGQYRLVARGYSQGSSGPYVLMIGQPQDISNSG